MHANTCGAACEKNQSAESRGQKKRAIDPSVTPSASVRACFRVFEFRCAVQAFKVDGKSSITIRELRAEGDLFRLHEVAWAVGGGHSASISPLPRLIFDVSNMYRG